MVSLTFYSILRLWRRVLEISDKGSGKQLLTKEVVQLYVRDEQARLQQPEKELKAFAKVHLEPGESKTVTLSIAREALAYYNDRANAWVAESGKFEVLVGASSCDIRTTASFTLTATSRFGGSHGKTNA